MGASVVILLSAYNGEAYIEEQIRSILLQDYAGSIALLIRDDGSQDGTLSVIRRLQAEDARIDVIEGSNIGMIASYFTLLKTALRKEYAYFAMADQDDYWLPEKLSSAIAALERGGEGPLLYGGRSEIADGALRRTGKKTVRRRRELSFFNTAIQNICPGHTQVMNRQMAVIVDRKTVAYDAIYCHDIWIANAAAIVGRILFDNTPHTLYRMHGINTFGYKTGPLSRLTDHLRRVGKRETERTAIQLRGILEAFREEMIREEREEAEAFLNSRGSAGRRLRYAVRSRFYRQSRVETLGFRLLYVFGAYDTWQRAERQRGLK